MIPVKQTRFGKIGNCFEACIASLLNIEDIPDFLAYEEGLWLEKTNKWLAENHRLVYMEVSLQAKEKESFFRDKDFFHILVGYTPRSTVIRHAVIGRKWMIVHDPHPDNTGILTDETLNIGILVNQCL